MTQALLPKQRAILDQIHLGLIVSCQARPNEPLFGAEIMARLAKAAELGGAVGIRANSPPDIITIKKMVNLPVIGIFKREYPDSEVYITPTIEEALAVAETGAEIIALDATQRSRPGGISLGTIVKELRHKTTALLMADISTIEEGILAEQLGFDLVATTLSGYTSYTADKAAGPDLELVEQLSLSIKIPVLAEGRIETPEQAAEAIKRGAWAVVVGTAITRPHIITQRFVTAIKQSFAKNPS